MGFRLCHGTCSASMKGDVKATLNSFLCVAAFAICKDFIIIFLETNIKN